MTSSYCLALLMQHDRFLILTHARPDGDTLGSGAALCSALRRAGKAAFLYPNGQTAAHFADLTAPYLAPAGFEPGFVVAVDTADVKLLAAGWTGAVQLCIDHHPSNTGYAAQTLLRAGSASCGEIILSLIEQLHGAPTPEEASLLYVALATDTGCFQHSNAGADAHRAAARLIDAGADAGALNRRLFCSSSAARLQLEGRIFSSLRIFHEGKTVFAVVTQQMLRECGAAEDDCDDLATLPGRLRGAEVYITIREQDDGSCRVSARSAGRADVCALCRRFGGGGHVLAAGCTLEGPPDAAVERLLAALEEQTA